MSDNSSIHVGSMVVCIRQLGPSLCGDHHPYLNQILTVREAADSFIPGDPRLFLRFREIVNPQRLFDSGFFEQMFDSEYFRPCRKTDISALNKHLMPMRDHVVT